MAIKLSKMTKLELADCAFLIERTFTRMSAVLAIKELKEAFKRKTPYKPVYIVAKDGDEIVGMCGFVESWMNSYIYHIVWLAVEPKCQGKGIGKMLVSYVINQVKERSGTRIILVTDKPQYYIKNFGFKTLQAFKPEGDHLMGLKL